ncbi:cytochrome P450 [Lasiosphaeria miniovina]|uniref:Cytochrome P450 n=1 Tax=Lasiosphaeria miniovina TaxID=1954250 RepID=A0AA40A5B3_9PEZI|nr:cytochrome P450 [Lasiosphaeria miniovina]KAK0709532.1 cytochrome P450 [Lasiosphaeria miniovina]
MDVGGVVMAAALVVVSLYLVLYRLQLTKTHPNEPPIVASPIPFVGHLLGMAVQGGRYVKGLGLRNRGKLIFTLPVPGSRIYMVTDPSLAAAVQRASKALSFTPLVPDITKRVLGLDAATIDIVRKNLDPEPGEQRGFLADIHDMVYDYLGPGDALNQLSFAAATELASQVNTYAASLPLSEQLPQPHEQAEVQVRTVNLLLWVRHFVAIATARFLYGDDNPIAARPELEEAFWDFDHGLGSLLMNVLPAVTARKPYRGREALAAAFAEYLRAGRHEKLADNSIVRKRVAIALAHGCTLEAAARSEVSFLFAGIVNTATTTFWVVLQIFASAGLLAEVREELWAAYTTTTTVVEKGETGDDEEEEELLSLSLDDVKTRCPTLLAVFRECLRLGSDNYSTRLVKTDTALAGGRFHLQAGSVVQIAGGAIHADKTIWGPDADKFNPGRFAKLQQQQQQQQQTQTQAGGGGGGGGIHPAAFRAFGGGKTLCPGRHFATHEILAFVAMIVLTFDLEAPPGTAAGAAIVVPGKEDGVLPVHILEPKKDVHVVVRRNICGKKGRDRD